jgi:diaminopropionate ammonia-lyase
MTARHPISTESFISNRRARCSASGYSTALRDIFDAADDVAAVIGRWPGYAETPLRSLDDLAIQLGISRLYYKDESERFGLGSFKALGGAYAVYRVLREIPGVHSGADGDEATITGMLAGRCARLTADVTVTSATAGNHGRSVAWGARLFGCRAVIFVHRDVSDARADAIAAYGRQRQPRPLTAGRWSRIRRMKAIHASRGG